MRNPAFTRQCIACRNRFNKNELIRLAKINGKIVIDKSNSGRGIYICKNKDCLDKAETKNLLNKALKGQIDSENKQNIFKELREFGRE